MTHHMIKKTDSVTGGSVQTGDVHTDMCTVDMVALERRLQKYIDEKFVQCCYRGTHEKMVLDEGTIMTNM